MAVASRPRVLTVAQAAEQLQVSPSTIRRLIAAGELSAVKVGRQTRVPSEALDAVLDLEPKEN